MIWIIIIILGFLFFICDKIFQWDLCEDDWDDANLRQVILICTIVFAIIIFCFMFVFMNARNQYMIDNKNIEIKKEMIKQIKKEYKSLNQDGKFINIENNNYMQKYLELQNSLYNDIKRYNDSLAFAKFRTRNKLWFIGFNKTYDDFNYLDLE